MSEERTKLQERIDELRQLVHTMPEPWVDPQRMGDYGWYIVAGANDETAEFSDSGFGKACAALAVAAVNLLPGVLDWAQETLDEHDDADGICGALSCGGMDWSRSWPCRYVLSLCAVLGVTP